MQRLLILTSLLFLLVSPAWAANVESDAAVGVATGDAPTFLGAPEWVQDDGGCQLPDLEGLSDAEARAQIEAAGMQETDAAAPPCPVAFSCNSITNCAAGSPCATADIGPCCTTGGIGMCCVSGSIKVRTCPCTCTGPLCAFSCINSDNVKWGCR